MKKSHGKNILEKLGFSLSLVCALHCLATPFLLAFLPAFGELFPEEWELSVILISFAIAVMIIGRDIQIHRHILPISLLACSFLVLIITHLLAIHNPIFDILGIAGILASYLLNWQKLRKAKACACA
ncbi:MAG: hypothetical protein OHK0045_09480 [Raineya sp.]